MWLVLPLTLSRKYLPMCSLLPLTLGWEIPDFANVAVHPLTLGCEMLDFCQCRYTPFNFKSEIFAGVLSAPL